MLIVFSVAVAHNGLIGVFLRLFLATGRQQHSGDCQG